MIFILDNYDSFTYNLVQYFGELGEEVVVCRPDEITIQRIHDLEPELIVVSPGPCSPDESVFSLTVIRHFKDTVPILGICLGHQAIGQVFGAKVIRAKTPVHGKVSLIRHDGEGVFCDLPNPLAVARYHSLALAIDSLPQDIVVTAQTADGEIMGIRHTSLPVEGVQFHPEAILTECGMQLLENAIKNARRWNPIRKKRERWQVRPLALSLPPRQLVYAFKNEEYPFFLDSGDQYTGLPEQLGEHSYLGANPFLTVSVYEGYYKLKKAGGPEVNFDFSPNRNSLSVLNPLSVLDDFLSRYKTPGPSPFPFAGGAVGFFSFDLKNEIENLPRRPKEETGFPLWTLSWYDGIIVYHHTTNKYYAVACGMQEDGQCDQELARMRLDLLENICKDSSDKKYSDKDYAENESIPTQSCTSRTISWTDVGKSTSKEQYLLDLKKVIEYIYAGDIYQANLSQRFCVRYQDDPWELYSKLRRINSAPFSAFLPYPDFQILCSSPERFIRITTGQMIETRPIKGTRPRGRAPAEDQKLAAELCTSEKDRAELTMIIDLERNDLGRICTYGTVKTKDLATLEKYPSVWHLAATIKGDLKRGLQAGQLLRAIFPGGSISGAPKIRALEIIDELEPYNRGIYTGSLGYIGFDGAWDLNIVIRTILLKGGYAYVHAGGGIVADSVPEDEYWETIYKASKLLEILGVNVEGG